VELTGAVGLDLEADRLARLDLHPFAVGLDLVALDLDLEGLVVPTAIAVVRTAAAGEREYADGDGRERDARGECASSSRSRTPESMPLTESHVDQHSREQGRVRAGRPERGVPGGASGAGMAQRLRPEDLAFLRNESASTPMHNATLEVFEPAAGGFDYERLVAPHRGPDRFRAEVPTARAQRPGSRRQPRLGRRRGLRPDLPRPPIRAAPPGLDGSASRARRPDHVSTPGPEPPALGGLPR